MANSFKSGDVLKNPKQPESAHVEILKVLESGLCEWRYYDWRYSSSGNEARFSCDHNAPFDFTGWKKVKKRGIEKDFHEVKEQSFHFFKDKYKLTPDTEEFAEVIFFYDANKEGDNGVAGRMESFAEGHTKYFIDPDYIVKALYQ